jgi:hypothetical protein
LAAAKARGVRLGNPNGAAHLREGSRAAAYKSAARRKEIANTADKEIAVLIAQILTEGTFTPVNVARQLNARRVPSRTGGLWSRGQARAVMIRVKSGQQS